MLMAGQGTVAGRPKANGLSFCRASLLTMHAMNICYVSFESIGNIAASIWTLWAAFGPFGSAKVGPEII